MDEITHPVSAPALLIHSHIPKTGGTSLEFVLRHCFRQTEIFAGDIPASNSSLGVSDIARLSKKWNALAENERRQVRLVYDLQLPIGAHEIFGRPAKYTGLVRDPVERVISHFRYMRVQWADGSESPIRRFLTKMTIEDYLDAELDLSPHNFHVRILSGCPELDHPFSRDGKPIAIAPVTGRHLELAKHNIEKHYLAIAPLEKFSSLVLLLRLIYGWPMHRALFEPQNMAGQSSSRISDATRERIAAMNGHDLALYSWVKSRFDSQIASFGPGFALEKAKFERLNHAVQFGQRVFPRPIRKWLAKQVVFRQPRGK